MKFNVTSLLTANTFSIFLLPRQGWISCEEYGRGNIWQVDPTGERVPVKITMGNKNPGPFEAFAFDDRNKEVSVSLRVCTLNNFTDI